MKRYLCIFGFCIFACTVNAACPKNFADVHMDNMILTTDASCPAGTVEYYTVDEMCTAHIH